MKIRLKISLDYPSWEYYHDGGKSEPIDPEDTLSQTNVCKSLKQKELHISKTVGFIRQSGLPAVSCAKRLYVQVIDATCLAVMTAESVSLYTLWGSVGLELSS